MELDERIKLNHVALKMFRISRGFSQHGLAAEAELSESSYRSYELGARNPTLRDAKKIADALGISVELIRNCDFDCATAAAVALLRMEELGHLVIFQGNDSTIDLVATSREVACEIRSARKLMYLSHS